MLPHAVAGDDRPIRKNCLAHAVRLPATELVGDLAGGPRRDQWVYDERETDIVSASYQQLRL